MYADLSRSTFDRRKNYTAVWAQQGRVQLDSDLNEQTAIVLDWLRTFALDFIGPFGGHVTRAGFELSYDEARTDLVVRPGAYYVHGLRCVGPPSDNQGRQITFCHHYQPVTGAPPLPPPPFMAYLVAWEQTVTARTDPDLLEPALGAEASETSVRSQVDWKIELWTDPSEFGHLDDDVERIAAQFEEWNGAERPRLRARVGGSPNEGDADDFFDDAYDPEVGSAYRGGRYRGLENQLYRVEVHQGRTSETGRPTVKWSRDNGSAEFGIEGFDDADEEQGLTVVRLADAPATGRSPLQVGDCVEVVDDNWVPRGTPHPLLQVVDIDPSLRQVTLDGAVSSHRALRPFLRRWDHPFAGVDGEPRPEGIPLPADGTLELEDGLSVEFGGPAPSFERGDHWMIPARTAGADVLWPRDPYGEPLAVAPHGPARYVAPLALIRGYDDVVDLRTLFTHLAWPNPYLGS